MIAYALCVFGGVIIGMFIMALAVAAKDDDD